MQPSVPHVIPYQGSKRKLAKRICSLFPEGIKNLHEPFAGSAAVTLYAAAHNMADHYVISDLLDPLARLWQQVINRPDQTAKRYSEIWCGDIDEANDRFLTIRSRYNQEQDPVDLLYLVARCVKNAVRFNRSGNFTQSADKRRLGTAPHKMERSIFAASALLKGRTTVRSEDFRSCICNASSRDLVYMDPPYHGTTYGKDKRYFMQVTKNDLIEGIEILNDNDIPFILSYDGKTGNSEYTEELPSELKMKRLWISGGISSQATLSGQRQETVESLYLSHQLLHLAENWCAQKGKEKTPEPSSPRLELV